MAPFSSCFVNCIALSGIYIHIPFCKSHCTYCAFYSELLRSSQGSGSFIADTVSAICAEIEASRASFDLADAQTLYLGGGTPSLLPLDQLERILDALGRRDFQEFTMEVNPDDIVKGGEEYALGLLKLGVNRVSMGVQSFDDAVLRRMGRRHNAAEALEAYALLRKAGFGNISIDFIFGFAPALDTGKISAQLGQMGLPEHISCYQLGIEEGSGLDKMVQKGLYVMPSDEECEAQYYAVCDMLRSLGYEHYEISNWALPGRRSRHNSAYWNHTPYIGFGPGAHSLFVGRDYVRRWNNPSLAQYLDASRSGNWDAVRGSETLSPEELAQERLFLGLRTKEGVDGKSIPENKWFISDSIILEEF